MPEVNATAAALLGLLHSGPLLTGGQLVASEAARVGPFFAVARGRQVSPSLEQK